MPVKGVRKMTAAGDGAQRLHRAARHRVRHRRRHPHDGARRAAARPTASSRDVKVSPLLVVAKALLLAVRRHPEVNASWDEAAQEIVVKHYVNLGIAAATPRGLVVPNIKDAERAVAARAGRGARRADRDRARGQDPAGRHGRRHDHDHQRRRVRRRHAARRSSTRARRRSSRFGAIRQQPWVHRRRGQAALGHARSRCRFDHRLVDGELGSRFLADVAAILEDPAQALVWA